MKLIRIKKNYIVAYNSIISGCGLPRTSRIWSKHSSPLELALKYYRFHLKRKERIRRKRIILRREMRAQNRRNLSLCLLEPVR